MTKPAFDPYFHYVNSVQSPEHDAELLKKMYLKNSKPSAKDQLMVLQEDFCGTAALCYEWSKLGDNCCAVGVDLDKKALLWGQENHGSELTKNEFDRVKLICGDVLKDYKITPNLICALNFSYFFIRERKKMVEYFRAAYKSLAKDGILVLDAFGGPAYLLPHSDKRRNSEHKFNFWWEIESFDSITNEMECRISYQRDGEKRRHKVFSYSWRLWSVPEIVDMLKEAGFKGTQYWSEGLDKSGNGDGKFRIVKSEQNCKAWVVYIVAKK